jgi:hypothetical protein
MVGFFKQGEFMHYDKVGPGPVNLSGDSEIDLVVAGTILTITDGKLSVVKMEDNVSLQTQVVSSIDPLDIKIDYISGTGNISSAANVEISTSYSEKVSINAVGDICAKGIGHESTLTAQNGKIQVDCVEPACELTAALDICAKNVASGSILTSTAGNIKALFLENNCQAKANKTVSLFCAGVNTTLSSETETIQFENIGALSAVEASGNITCSSVGVNAAVESNNADVTVYGKILDGAAVKAKNKLSAIGEVGVGGALRSTNGEIDFCGDIKAAAAFQAVTGVNIKGRVGNGVAVTATNGPINIEGNILSNATINGVGVINIRGNVGDLVRLRCPGGTINIWGNVSPSMIPIAATVNIHPPAVKQDTNYGASSPVLFPASSVDPKPAVAASAPEQRGSCIIS